MALVWYNIKYIILYEEEMFTKMSYTNKQKKENTYWNYILL